MNNIFQCVCKDDYERPDCELGKTQPGPWTFYFFIMLAIVSAGQRKGEKIRGEMKKKRPSRFPNEVPKLPKYCMLFYNNKGSQRLWTERFKSHVSLILPENDLIINKV